jgi:hypothetical protein
LAGQETRLPADVERGDLEEDVDENEGEDNFAEPHLGVRIKLAPQPLRHIGEPVEQTAVWG